jgi:hypothetical protein
MAAIADTTISGAEVPKPTTSIPINSGGIPAYLDVAAAPSTKRSALHSNKINPDINDNIARSILINPNVGVSHKMIGEIKKELIYL